MRQARKAILYFPSVLLLGLALLAAGRGRAAVREDLVNHSWNLTSGGTEYQLSRGSEGVSLEYFGPEGKLPAKSPGPKDLATDQYDISGQAEGEDILPALLTLVSAHETSPSAGVSELRLLFQHRRLPLRIEMSYFTWGDSGVITRRLVLKNLGNATMHIERMPSLTWNLPAGKYELTHLGGGWGQERQVETEALGFGERAFVATVGRSTNGYSPWFCLKNKSSNLYYMAELAYSGNWQMHFSQTPLTGDRAFWQNQLRVQLGMRFDFGGALALQPGEAFQLPEVAFTTSAVSLDEAANKLHRYQREFVIAHTPANHPLLVQFNSWYPFSGTMTVSEIKRCANLAAKLGAEVFVLDSGWYSSRDWESELGDYVPDAREFPNGLEELASHVRTLGMKFGIWVEIENVGVKSRVFAEHPDWCLQYNGAPIARGARRQLDFTKPEVRQWARSVIDRLVKNYGIEWLKIDYNIDIGEKFDPASTTERPGDVLYRNVTNYYAWLDEVRAAHPGLVIENCASGGLRFDLGIMAHAHTSWLSDEIRPKPSVQLAYGCTLEFTPGICNHWMVGDNEHGEVSKSDEPGWWDFLFRVPMNGQFGISSRVFDWSPELLQHAQDNVALYKRVRNTLENADAYHLTPPPEHDDPKGWMAIQYVGPKSLRSIVMAYRLGQSASNQKFQLHGLDADTAYEVKSAQKLLGKWTGRELVETGLSVRLDAPWRAIVIELDAVK